MKKQYIILLLLHLKGIKYELNNYMYKLNDDNTVRFVTVDASVFI